MRGPGPEASRRGFVRIRVRCERGIRDCHGSLRLADRRGKAIARGRKRIALARAPRASTGLRLGPRNRRGAAAPRRALRAMAVVRTRSPWGTVRTAHPRDRGAQGMIASFA